LGNALGERLEKEAIGRWSPRKGIASIMRER